VWDGEDLKRTIKMLEAAALPASQVEIVNLRWLEQSVAKGVPQDVAEGKFCPKDVAFEKKHGFKIAEALARRREGGGGGLRGGEDGESIRVHVTKSVSRPPPVMLRTIIGKRKEGE
jgi:hypothetical protein